MSLAAWQTALTLMVRAHASHRTLPTGGEGPLADLDLLESERAWLSQIADAPGFRLTCSIQRWWRELRLKASARLTLSALPSQERHEMLRAWLDDQTETSFFYAREATAFLEYVLSRLPAAPHLESVCRFERGIHLAAAAAGAFARAADSMEVLPGEATLERHPAASLVTFAAPPEAVLGAVVARSPLPEVGAGAFPVLIAPGLPHYCRSATEAEVALWNRCASPVTLVRLCAADPLAAAVIRPMLAIGALAIEDLSPHG